uniref:DUF218 domain-containing protein n=1 Tax=Aureoumbra lagunensis TaxID=44058 RepID=A0A7S3JW69_9STRA
MAKLKSADSSCAETIGIVILAHGYQIENEKLSRVSFDDVTDFKADTKNLGLEHIVQRAEIIIRSYLDQGQSIVVITSGAKRKWTDSLSLGDVLMREIVRTISLKAFLSPAKAFIQVEDSSIDLHQAAKHTTQLLLKHNIDRLCVITHSNIAQCQDAFQSLLPKCPVDVFLATASQG